MAEHLYTHEQVMILVQMGKADAWEHGYRDGIGIDAWSKQNPYREEK